MKWDKLTIQTNTEAEDLVVDMLAELGITGVEIVDKQAVLTGETLDNFREVMPEIEEDDGLASVIFYLDEDDDREEILRQVSEGLEELKSFMDIGAGIIEVGETEDKDWVNNWKKHFHAFYVDDILIKPTWVDKPVDDHSSIMIEIDPGTAFGTGSHETTKLCIHAIRKYVKPGDQILDVGTGSGILGIIALKFGADHAFGTDIDELAVKTAIENAELNGFGEKDFTAILGNIIDDPEIQQAAGFECYDMVVANILADIIIPLSAMIHIHMKPGALFVCSGIINMKEDAVREALLKNPELEILETTYEGDWVSFTVRKKG